MMRIATALLFLALALPAHGPGPAHAQGNARAEAMRALDRAEAGLRDAIARIEDGRVPGGSASSRLRQALSDVERAMMQLPSESRAGPAWQTAVKELTEAQAMVREDSSQPEAAKEAASEVLGALPALRGNDTATGSS